MDKTKSKLAAFFDNDEDDSSYPQKAVDSAKLSQYASGKVRKSRREKEQELAELKKKEEEANAAKAYAEFLDAFEGEDVSRRKAGSSFVKSSNEEKAVYVPASGGPSHFKSRHEPSNNVLQQPPSPPPVAPKPKGKRAMDAFLEEIKREQAEREARYGRHAHREGKSVTALAAYEGQSGSKDRGDPQTSNVFVANLPQHVTEQTLGQFFAKYGPVGSVKVMWPRADGTSGPGADMTASRRTKNTGLSGFVSFMKRKDAEIALRELDGFDWGGSVLRVGWSKAVPIAAKPMFTSSEYKSGRGRSRSRSAAHSYSRSNSRSRSRSPRRRSRTPAHQSRHYHSRSRSRDRKRSRSRGYGKRHYDSHSRSPHRKRSRSHDRPHVIEDDGVTDTFIRAVAAEVKGQDAKYEEKLREREQSNPKFGFMLQKNHRRHAFYRGLIESEREIHPEFDDEGYNSVYSTDSAEEEERERVKKNTLGKLARKRFEAMVRAMSGKRGEIARCMAFCLEHAEAAHEVADIIVASLLVDGTAVPRKLARLHLICDILHNSAASVPSAWKFRQEFQSRLGIVFDHMANIYHSFPGRITAETFKKQITAVVDVWEDWIVFPADFTFELRIRLEGAVKEAQTQTKVSTEAHDTETPFISRFKASSFQLAAEGAVMDTTEDVDGEPISGDVDGEPIDDVDGVSVDDIDGDPLDDLDGVPLDDVDGDPLDEGVLIDIDGEALDGEPIDGDPIESVGEITAMSAPRVQNDSDGEPMDQSDDDA
ncbi:hypothetical protein BDN72DRAFT_834269 [Pluteus cervinus]|uniref:Uncharacterized protein n=1 Tax=Pluteus cervinus TaxID=181527 RepID=A0ACD3B778_9AGAR|nr:hypothetical protein BDN72DRAFT_834269 [Pluteus cervinus]